MSAACADTAIISLGVSCQASMQIEAHLPLISDLTGRQFARSGFPFDSNIMLPSAFCAMAVQRQFFPDRMEEITLHKGPSWPEGRVFWHDFKINGVIRVCDTFCDVQQKYLHTCAKFMSPVKRRFFVLSNVQNNLDEVSASTGFDFRFDEQIVGEVAASIASLFPHSQNHLIVVTSRDRALDDYTRWDGNVYLLDRSTRDVGDTFGDVDQWRTIFLNYFDRSLIARGRRALRTSAISKLAT